MDFAVAAAGALEPDQLNACGNGGFCRRRWDGFQPLPPIGDSRKKKGGGEICACFRTLIPLLAGVCPTSENFAVGWLSAAAADRRQPQKKRAVGKFVPASARSSPCLRGSAPPRKRDPLTVISLSPRKSPGAAGALSLTPDGVSDPAAASGPRPSEAIPPVAKQGGDAKRGEGEARKAGERAV